MYSHRPKFYVFAGNNGSGKSTFRNLIIDKIGIDINIDPDAIARRIDPENPESNRVTAGKEVIRSVSAMFLPTEAVVANLPYPAGSGMPDMGGMM